MPIPACDFYVCGEGEIEFGFYRSCRRQTWEGEECLPGGIFQCFDVEAWCVVRKCKCWGVGFVIAGLVMQHGVVATGLPRYPWRYAQVFVYLEILKNP